MGLVIGMGHRAGGLGVMSYTGRMALLHRGALRWAAPFPGVSADFHAHGHAKGGELVEAVHEDCSLDFSGFTTDLGDPLHGGV